MVDLNHNCEFQISGVDLYFIVLEIAEVVQVVIGRISSNDEFVFAKEIFDVIDRRSLVKIIQCNKTIFIRSFSEGCVSSVHVIHLDFGVSVNI